MARSRKSLLGQVSDVDLRLLKVFRTVVECGGFSQAEVALNVSGASISVSMSDLEKRLKLRLCQRGRAGFSLTEEGQKVYEATLQLLISLEDFRSKIHAVHSELRGELAIGLADNLVTMHRMQITNALTALKRQAPDVYVRIRMMSPPDVEIAVLDGAINVGVVPVVHAQKGLSYLDLYEEETQLYCSDQHPLFAEPDDHIDAQRLRVCDAVIPAFALPSKAQLLHQNLSGSASATDREGVAFLILTGLYIGYLPTHYAQRWVSEGRMRSICPEQCFFMTPYAAITRKGTQPNLVLAQFLEELRQHHSE